MASTACSSAPRRVHRWPRESGGFDPTVHSRSPDVAAMRAVRDFGEIASIMSSRLGIRMTTAACRDTHNRAVRKLRQAMQRQTFDQE